MPKKIQPETPFEIPGPGTNPEIKPDVTPDYPDFPEKKPDIIPEGDPREIPPPYEIPPPGKNLNQKLKAGKTYSFLRRSDRYS